MAKYTKKGSQIAVEGAIKTDSYNDEQGNKRYRTYVLASNVQFLERKQDNNGFENMPEPPMQESKSEEKDPFEAFGQAVEIDDNNLPF